MYRKILRVVIFFLILIVFFGCGPKVLVKTKLDQLFENNFEGLETPEVTKIKEAQISKSFPYATFDEVWDAIIIMVTQQGIIVRSNRDSGVIAVLLPVVLGSAETIIGGDTALLPYPLPHFPVIFMPMAVVFVERGEVVTVYLNWENPYERLDKPEVVTVEFTPDLKEGRAKDFFDELATQVYAKEKWNYLYK